jgi:hypothetical protein
MEEKSKIIDLKDFPLFLAMVTKTNLTELSNLLDISRGTLHNWKNGTTRKIDSDSINKLANKMIELNWGFRIGKIRDSEIEIIYESKTPQVLNEEQIIYQSKITEQQDLINKLVKENFTLKEKLEKYESNKH